ncbi:MAG: multiheme c-type cytochrome, partial [Planctomycetia bacterium]
MTPLPTRTILYRRLAVAAFAALVCGAAFVSDGWGQAQDADSEKPEPKSVKPEPKSDDDAPADDKPEPKPVGKKPKSKVASKDAGKVVDRTKPVFLGEAACKQCHAKPAPDAWTDVSRQIEHGIWVEEDKHSQAHAILKNDRSKQMMQLLGWKGAATEETRCLTCHSIVAPKDRQAGSFKVAEGVSCEACHGPSSMWNGRHDSNQRAEWLDLGFKGREELGFRDVRNPVKRAAMCVSCHIGNQSEGKVLTHEMYAAGHPPLPSIELGYFSENEPRHWRSLREKLAEVKAKPLAFASQFARDENGEPIEKPKPADIVKAAEDQYRELGAEIGWTPDSLEQTPHVLVGGVVALRETMRYLAARSSAEPAADGEYSWPDLTQFDCASCHHDLPKVTEDLSSFSWRQSRPSALTAGRVPLRLWQTTLTRAALDAVGGDPMELDALLAPLNEAASARPFGEPTSLAAAAG